MSITYKDVGREAMMAHHNVFKVHDIPPAMYYGPGIPRGINPEFNQGDICSAGLWDETVNQPEVYPFVADKEGYCYMPEYTNSDVYINDACVTQPPPMLSVHATKPNTPFKRCGMGCSWTE
jgi:hypothetical protein